MIDHMPLNSTRLDTALADLMTPGVVAIPASASLRRVFDAIRVHRVHAVLVHDDGAPLGWATCRALLRSATADLALHVARDAIDEPVVMLSPNAAAHEAIDRMVADGVGRVAVGHDPRELPEGVISDLDLVDLLVGHGVRRHA